MHRCDVLYGGTSKPGVPLCNFWAILQEHLPVMYESLSSVAWNFTFCPGWKASSLISCASNYSGLLKGSSFD